MVAGSRPTRLKKLFSVPRAARLAARLQGLIRSSGGMDTVGSRSIFSLWGGHEQGSRFLSESRWKKCHALWVISSCANVEVVSLGCIYPITRHNYTKNALPDTPTHPSLHPSAIASHPPLPRPPSSTTGPMTKTFFPMLQFLPCSFQLCSAPLCSAVQWYQRIWCCRLKSMRSHVLVLTRLTCAGPGPKHHGIFAGVVVSGAWGNARVRRTRMFRNIRICIDASSPAQGFKTCDRIT